MQEDSREEKFNRKYALLQAAALLLRYGHSPKQAVENALLIEAVLNDIGEFKEK